MPSTPFWSYLSFNRSESHVPDDKRLVSCGRILYGGPEQPEQWQLPEARCLIELWGMRPDGPLYGRPPKETDVPVFLHGDLLKTLYTEKVGGLEQKHRRAFGYIDTREDRRNPNEHYYVVDIYMIPLIRRKGDERCWFKVDI